MTNKSKMKGMLQKLFDTVMEFNENTDDDDYESYGDICDECANIANTMECMEIVEDGIVDF